MTDEITLDVTYLNLILAVALPAIVALVTRRLASPGVKALVLALLTILAGVIQQVINNNGTFSVKETVGTILVQFVSAVALHYGLLKPIGVTGTNGALQRATAGVGIGSSAPTTDDGYTSGTTGSPDAS